MSNEFENLKAPNYRFFFPLVCLFSSLYTKSSVDDSDYATKFGNKGIFFFVILTYDACEYS